MPIFSHRTYSSIPLPDNLQALVDGDSPNARIKEDGTLQLKNEDTGLYHTPGAGGQDGYAFPVLTSFGES